MANPTDEERKQKWWDKERTWFWVGASGLSVGSLVLMGMVINDRIGSKTSWIGKSSDYAHELASAFLGAIVTVAITAFLLKAQQESTAELQESQIKAQARAEKERENSAKFFEQKIEAYEVLLQGVAEFLHNHRLEDPDAEFTKLTLSCIHVSYIADKIVLAKLKDFTAKLLDIIKNDKKDVVRGDERSPITQDERRIILRSFAEVAASIKTDLHRSRITLEEDINRLTESKETYNSKSPGKEKVWLELIQGIIDNLSLCNTEYIKAEKRLKEREQEDSWSA